MATASRRLLSATVIVLACLMTVECLERVDLYPFGTVQGDQRLPVGDDVSSSDIQLDTPINFYDEVFTSLYVNLNGLISFETELPAYRSNFIIPFGYKVIAPFLADVDINLGGYVYYRETQDPSLLNKAGQDIIRAFPDHSGFDPESIFMVTWDDVGSYQNQYHPTNTFQMIIVSDGHDSFAMFLYPSDGINWIRGQGKDVPVQVDPAAQAGFDSGESERYYTLPGSGNDDVTRLTRTGNSGVNGVWIFHIGNTNGGNILTPDMTSSRTETVSDSHSNSCADGGQQTCSRNARCTDYDRGFCCACSPPYIGNGEDCIRPDEAQRVNGRVSGYLNDEPIDSVDLHSYIVTTDGRTYTAISRIPSTIGHSLQTLYTVGSVLGFLFALPQQPRTKNGFMVTGSHFNRTVTIQFQSSRDTVTLTQSFTGQDVQGHMRLATQIDGRIPRIGDRAKVEVDDYSEEYRRVSPGVLKAHSTQTLRIDGQPSYVTIDQTINYEECAAQPLTDFGSVRLAVTRNFVVYSDSEQIVRFSQTNKVSGATGEEPGPADGCRSMQCGLNAECNPHERPARCVCKSGYTGDGYRCELDGERVEEDCNAVQDYCDVNAQCIYSGRDRRYSCRCNDGFEGDGRRCTRRDCRRDSRVCDTNARCERRGSESVCVCNPGFRGDGYNVCVASGDRSSYLLYAQGMYIMETPFTPRDDDAGKQTLYIPGQTAIGIDADCQSNYFYWSDISGKTISRAKLDGTDSEVIVRNLGSPEGVAIDWLSKNLYWTDSGVDRIELSRVDGTHHKTLFSTDLVNPRAIAVDPIRGVMFWADWNRDAPKIEKSNMDGTDRKLLINDGLSLPNGLTLDFDLYNVCWADAGNHKVECANYDGRNRRVLSQSAGYPFGLVYNQDVFYWTDWERINLPNINKNSDRPNTEITAPLGANGRMYGITAVRNPCPAGSNPCIHNNGGCRFLCLPSSKGGRTCACPDDISPDECNRIGLL